MKKTIRKIYLCFIITILFTTGIALGNDTNLENKEYTEIYKQWLELGLSIIVLTRGSEGAIIKTKNCEATSRGEKVEVVDTIGAGDIFNGALLFSLSNHEHFSKKDLINIDKESLEESLKFANKVAAISVGRTGANPPFFNELDF